MKIGIVGAGAIGTLFGFSLANAQRVIALVRSAKIARAIADRGGFIVNGAMARRVVATHDPDALCDVDLLLVAVKAHATIDALAPMRGVLAEKATIVSLQNGIDAAAQIEYAMGHRHAIAVGPTTEAAILIEPGIARRADPGTTHLGWVRGHDGGRDVLEEIGRVFTQSDLRVHMVDDPAPYQWAKLVVNAGINPVAALAGVTNGEVIERDDLRRRAETIAIEVSTLAVREGIILPFADPVSQVHTVAKATASNRSSMLQDFDRGRPTEVEAILGTVVRRAATLGVPVPASLAALDEVRRRTTA